MSKKRFIYLLVLVVCSIQLQAQEFVREFESSGNQRIALSGRITALAIQAEAYSGESVTITLSGQQLEVPHDPDAPDYTYFISIEPQQVTSISLDFPATIFLINSGESPQIFTNQRMNQANCDFTPDPILQSEWRTGLPAPNYTRSFTQVEHVIVHHSAGSNTATDYTQIVRDIYLYHTQTHGWSDIGYNYLVAQNGDLYAGRDPAGGAQDNVLGAHFCGHNSGTMGICLLGNYETAQPNNDLWSTLQRLAVFKMKKEDLDPLGYSSHALGSIGHIAGHRDGCSTLCPGANVYDKLDGLRTKVSDMLQNCEKSLSISYSNLTVEAGQIIQFSNGSTGYDHYTWIFEGGDPPTADWTSGGIVTYNNPGKYSITLIGKVNEVSDTLSYPDVILVKSVPKIFPNPASSFDQITVASEDVPEEIVLMGLDGKVINFSMLDDKTIQLQGIRPGIYVIRLKIPQGWTSKKLLIKKPQ